MLHRTLIALLCAGTLVFAAPPAGEEPAPAPAPQGAEPPAGEAPTDGLETPPYDMTVVDEIDCDSVPAWDDEVFAASEGSDDAQLEPFEVARGSFLDRAGFKHYTHVFGIPVVVSDTIGSVTLGQASRTLASLLDNDEDGEPDNPLYVEGLKKYRVIFGFFPSGAASEQFWRNADKRPSYKPFMEQYLCNMHFVEIWQADLSPVYYTSMRERAGLIEAGTLDGESPNILKRCGGATTEKFDLSLWYYLFSIYYYGVVDHLSPAQAQEIESAMQYVTDSRGFNPHYGADPEMTLADFLAWSTLTRMGALECHCTQGAVQNHWRPCRASDLPEPLVELIDSLPDVPKKIPNPNYPNGDELPAPVPETDPVDESLSVSAEE